MCGWWVYLPEYIRHAARNTILALSVYARACLFAMLQHVWIASFSLDSKNSVTIVNVGSKFNLNPSPTMESSIRDYSEKPVFIDPDY